MQDNTPLKVTSVRVDGPYPRDDGMKAPQEASSQGAEFETHATNEERTSSAIIGFYSNPTRSTGCDRLLC